MQEKQWNLLYKLSEQYCGNPERQPNLSQLGKNYFLWKTQNSPFLVFKGKKKKEKKIAEDLQSVLKKREVNLR